MARLTIEPLRKCKFDVARQAIRPKIKLLILEGQAEANRWRGAATRGSPARLQAGVHRARRDLRRLSIGLRGVRRQHHDSRTLRTIVATMEARHGMLGRVWISDRGMASADNLAA